MDRLRVQIASLETMNLRKNSSRKTGSPPSRMKLRRASWRDCS